MLLEDGEFIITIVQLFPQYIVECKTMLDYSNLERAVFIANFYFNIMIMKYLKYQSCPLLRSQFLDIVFILDFFINFLTEVHTYYKDGHGFKL